MVSSVSTQCEARQLNHALTQCDEKQLSTISTQCDAKALVDSSVQTDEPFYNPLQIHQLKHYVECMGQILNEKKTLNDENYDTQSQSKSQDTEKT